MPRTWLHGHLETALPPTSKRHCWYHEDWTRDVDLRVDVLGLLLGLSLGAPRVKGLSADGATGLAVGLALDLHGELERVASSLPT